MFTNGADPIGYTQVLEMNEWCNESGQFLTLTLDIVKCFALDCSISATASAGVMER